MSDRPASLPVSVVIPCFRCAATVERTVESVRLQTVPPAEIVLVDDASDDGTGDVLRRLMREPWGNTSVRLIGLETNCGAASARNAGWQAAQSKYIAFLDADATWHPRKLEIQGRFMERHADAHLSGHLHLMGSRKGDTNRLDDIAVKQVRFGDLLWRNRFITSSVMLRRDLPIRFEDGQRHMEDHRLWLDAARAGYGIFRLEAPLAFHHKPDFGAGGLSANLAAMERAELSNYLSLYRNKAFGRVRLTVLWSWSMAKFARRLAIVSMRRFS